MKTKIALILSTLVLLGSSAYTISAWDDGGSVTPPTIAATTIPTSTFLDDLTSISVPVSSTPTTYHVTTSTHVEEEHEEEHEEEEEDD